MQKLRFNAPLVGLFFITFCFNIELQANEHDISKIIEESKKIAKNMQTSVGSLVVYL